MLDEESWLIGQRGWNPCSVTCLLSREECAENRCLDLCLQVSWDGPLWCLPGADVFLNPFFKWSCCTACHDR